MVPAVVQIPRSLTVEALRLDEAELTILAEATAGRWSVRGEPAKRIHSRYVRMFADLPRVRLGVTLRVHVRTFFCDIAACHRRIVAGHLDGFAPAFASRTDRQRVTLEAIA